MVTTDWEIGNREQQEEVERRAEEMEIWIRAFEEAAGPGVVVHDPIEFRDRSLLRVEAPGGEVWYESGGRTYANVWDQLPAWRDWLAWVEARANELSQEADLWPGSADPCHPAWDE